MVRLRNQYDVDRELAIAVAAGLLDQLRIGAVAFRMGPMVEFHFKVFDFQTQVEVDVQRVRRMRYGPDMTQCVELLASVLRNRSLKWAKRVTNTEIG